MKLTLADPLPDSAIAMLRDLPECTVEDLGGCPRARLLAALRDTDVLIVRSATRVDRELFDHAPVVKVVARAGSGVDNIDVAEATARGILVLNAPGANSVSVAEHTWALLLALARTIPDANAAMKRQTWDKRRFVGVELAGKTLGLLGLGRVGQEVARRAAGFGMKVVAHDPYIAEQRAADLGVELLPLDAVCERADYLSLHAPLTPATRGLLNADRLARCRRGVRIINTARGELIDPRALAAALASGHVGGAALDVFDEEPPRDWSLIGHPRVIATPHIAAATVEAQELVGTEIAQAVRDYVREGVVRNAVNLPSLTAEELHRVRPSLVLAERLGSFGIQLERGHVTRVGLRYYGALAESPTELVTSAALVGVLRPILSGGVTAVNAAAIARGRGIEVVESRSSRPRDFTALISLKLQSSAGERWLEGAVFERERPRLVLIDGVRVEAPLEGTMLIMWNRDQPGVIGDVGTILGRRGINISCFALGRSAAGAVGVINIDEPADRPTTGVYDQALAEIRAVEAIWDVALVTL